MPNQEFDMASKKLFAALATGDLLLFLVAVDDVIEVLEFMQRFVACLWSFFLNKKKIK